MNEDCLLNIQTGGMNYFDDDCDDIITQKIHLHIQQRNGRNLGHILKAWILVMIFQIIKKS